MVIFSLKITEALEDTKYKIPIQMHFYMFIEISVLVTQSLSHVRHLCDLMDCSPRGSAVHGILQARILE